MLIAHIRDCIEKHVLPNGMFRYQGGGIENGAFLVSASLEDGSITAEIVSEKGQTLRIEKPGDGYFVQYRGQNIPLEEQITVLETMPGETIFISQ